MFFNFSTMSANDIQSFFNGKAGPCQFGYMYLKDYRQAMHYTVPRRTKSTQMGVVIRARTKWEAESPRRDCDKGRDSV